MEIVDTLIAIALLIWCVMTTLSIHRNAQGASRLLPTPVAAKLTTEVRIDTLTDRLGRI